MYLTKVYFLALALIWQSVMQAQRPQFTIARFQPVKTGKLSYKPFTVSDFSRTDKSKGENDLITLPNKKKVTLGSYLRTINAIEKNLSEIGISRDRVQLSVLASAYKPLTTNTASVTVTTAGKGILLSKTATSNRFALNRMSLSDKAISLSKTISRGTDLLQKDADLLPDEPFNTTEEITLPDFKVADYGVKVKASYSRKGILDPFSLSGTRLKQDSLNLLIKNTSNEFSLGFNVSISADIPALGNFPVYKLESEFVSKANKDQNHKSRAKLQVLEKILLNENVSPTGDSYTYNKDAVYNTKQKLGAADIFNYGLNILLPVDLYLLSTGVGAEFSININRTGVGGTISPLVTQSIVLETSATETTGPVADLLNFDVLDIGVGGELRLLQGSLDFGGNAGLAVNNGTLQFINDTYNAATLKMLRGRLYTFYTYPIYTCNSIFSALDPACYAVRRVENNFFDTGAFLEFNQVLADDFKGRNLKWK